MQNEDKPLLSEKQVEYINKLGLPFVVTNDLSLLSDDEFDQMDNAVADYLMGGFGADGEPEDEERVFIGEDIMDFIGKNF
ncbi:MAG: hypothetical protein VB108_06795 [Anaerolineaceae bacterium]|nr:hypothetical protein [Anaerolineaceae bacterium]